MQEKLILLENLRIERNKPRKCTCPEFERSYVVDKVNRQVTCGCGMVCDPFEALNDMAMYYERENEQHKRMYEQREEWVKQKPHSVLFKQLERDYRKGTYWPTCPKCSQAFDYKDINGHYNAEFYKAMEAKKNSLGEEEHS